MKSVTAVYQTSCSYPDPGPEASLSFGNVVRIMKLRRINYCRCAIFLLLIYSALYRRVFLAPAREREGVDTVLYMFYPHQPCITLRDGSPWPLAKSGSS